MPGAVSLPKTDFEVKYNTTETYWRYSTTPGQPEPPLVTVQFLNNSANNGVTADAQLLLKGQTVAVFSFSKEGPFALSAKADEFRVTNPPNSPVGNNLQGWFILSLVF